MSEMKREDAERKLLTLKILDGTIDRPTAADLVACIGALERRIEKLEADMFAQHAIAMNHSDSIEHIERKLNHKGGNE